MAEEEEVGGKLKNELRACHQRCLVVTEMEMGDIEYLTSNKLGSAAKIIIALGFVLRNIETGKNRYFQGHENNKLFEKSHLQCT